MALRFFLVSHSCMLRSYKVYCGNTSKWRDASTLGSDMEKNEALYTAMYLSSYTGKLYIQERHIVMSWQCIIYDLCMKYNCHIRIMISLYSLTMIQGHNVIIMVMNLKTNYMAKNQLMPVVIFGSYTKAFKNLMLWQP